MTTTTHTRPAVVHRTLLHLNAHDPTVRAALTDTHHMHTLVMSGFTIPAEATNPRTDFGVLYATQPRPGNTLAIIVQSNTPPAYPHLPTISPPSAHTENVDYTTGSDTTHHFELTAAPIRNEPRPGKHRGARRAITNPTDQLAWLQRQGAQHGFEVITATTTDPADLQSETKSLPRPQRRTPRSTFHIKTARYTGTLTVTNPTLFNRAKTHGIGTGKAYGTGLLLTRPA